MHEKDSKGERGTREVLGSLEDFCCELGSQIRDIREPVEKSSQIRQKTEPFQLNELILKPPRLGIPT